MKMAPICVWIAAGSSCGSSDIGSLQSESDRNLSLPHDRPLSAPHGIFAAPTRNSEHSVRGCPLCHTRESGYPARRDAATQGLRLAGVASRRNSVSVVVSWMPAFAGMTRGKRPIQAPVGLVQGGPAAGRYELAMTERARADGNSQST